MASYTYSLTDNGDGAASVYFGTASMATFNDDQSIEFVESYVQSNLVVSSSELFWAGESAIPSPADYTTTEYLKISYLSPSQPLTSSTTFANVSYIEPSAADHAIFGWNYLSYIKKYNYKDLSINWYVEGPLNEEGEPEKLASFYLQEIFKLSMEEVGIEDTEVTVMFYQNLVTYTIYYNSDIAIYQNYGISDPTVYPVEYSSRGNSESTTTKIPYSYKSGELAGIRTKFASPAGSTSLSLMQAMISSSVDKIYNTSNISRFNFKKTRAEALKPREVSSIDLVKDFNRPYRGTTSG